MLLTVQQQLQFHDTPILGGIIEEDVLDLPELLLLNAKVKAEEKYKKLKKTRVGTIGFRVADQAPKEMTGPRYKWEEVTGAMISGIVKYDSAKADQNSDPSALIDIRTEFSADAMEAADRVIAKSVWYGQDNDEASFDGLQELVHPDLDIDMGSGDPGAHRSAYLIRQGDQGNEKGVSLVYLLNRIAGFVHDEWQTGLGKDSEGNDGMPIEWNELRVRAGLEVLNKYSVVRLRGFSPIGGAFPITDTAVHKVIAEKLAPVGINPRARRGADKEGNQGGDWNLWMPNVLQEELRQSRDNANKISRTPAGEDAVLPDDCAGIRIIPTPNLSLTEA